MISGLKPLLEALDEIESVDLAEDLVDSFSDLNPENLPRCILWNGENNYEMTATPMDVKQPVLKTAEVMLICRTAEIDALEATVVQALLGYKHTEQHDGLNASKSWNHKVVGPYTSRRIQFIAESNVFQQYP